MVRRLLGAMLTVVMLFGCSGSNGEARSGADGQPGKVSEQPAMSDAEMVACKQKNTQPLSLAGVQVGTGAEPVLARLGQPAKVETSARDNHSRYHYAFGTVGVDGMKKISDIALLAESPLGQLWPGVQLGTQRSEVLDKLAALGLCGIPQPGGNEVSFPHASGAELLTLAFGPAGELAGARLIQVGP